VTVLPDGTYATQTALSESAKAAGDEDAFKGPALQKLVLDGDVFLGSVAVLALTKLVLKGADTADQKLRTLLLACNVLKRAKTFDQVCCMGGWGLTRHARTGGTRGVFETLLRQQRDAKERDKKALEAQIKAQPFEQVPFRQLRAKTALGVWTDEADDDMCLELALGNGKQAQHGEPRAGRGLTQRSGFAACAGRRVFQSKTNNRVNVYTNGGDAAAGSASKAGNIHALTGSTDPVYVEATVRCRRPAAAAAAWGLTTTTQVTVADFDIVVDFLVINRTDTTLTNVEIELCVVGDLKLGERHPPFTMGPRDYKALQTSIKVVRVWRALTGADWRRAGEHRDGPHLRQRVVRPPADTHDDAHRAAGDLH
jgi:coatomer subunit beta